MTNSHISLTPNQVALDTLTTALSVTHATAPALDHLREVALPYLKLGGSVRVQPEHTTALLDLLTAYENAVLARYDGARTVQRARCRREHPSLLSDITRTRTWLRRSIAAMS